MSLHETTMLYFIPKNDQSYLSYNGRDYRGLIVLKASPMGLVLVNIINIEDYLKGVVPSELSPYDFRELEAHKAQAVAARTYAIKKLGVNGDLGFDISDTPKDQFYVGMNAEHPLSSQAVEMTQGEVVLYKGKLIDALYTSTCGGMTEDVENIFGGPAHPYLRSTECTYERQKEYLIESLKSILPVMVDNTNISPMLVALVGSKVIPSQLDPEFYSEEASYEEAVSWTQNALDVLERQGNGFSPQSSDLNYGSFVRLAVHAFDWEERIQNLMLESEREFILKDYPSWDGEEKASLAYFIQSGIFSSSLAVKNPEATLTRGELAYYLGKIVQSYRDLAHSGIFKGLEEDEIELEKDTETIKLRLSPEIILLVNNSGEYAFDSRLSLLGGEKVRWIEEEGKVQMLEVIYPPLSNILDRASKLHLWYARKSKQELEERINQFYPIGELLDLVPQIRGESKRVVELLIQGSETQALVKGFKIRRVLGLRETLFVIDREYDETNTISHFTFRGKGWGHGVGLCQVGAVGMARVGARYKDILKKYYQGVKISKIY
jgi:stage II sporulation protein D